MGTTTPTANDFSAQLEEVRVALRQRSRQQQQLLDSLADKVLDAYRAALGYDFTAGEVLKAAQHGADIKDLNEVPAELQDVLWATGAKLPEGADKEKAPTALSDALDSFLSDKGMGLSEAQKANLPDFMRGALASLENAGASFDNGVHKARILGLNPLLKYYEWIIDCGQQFMAFDESELQLRLIQNGIKATQKALATALEAAGDIKVTYGLDNQVIEGIVKAEVIANPRAPEKSVVKYRTASGKTGEIDLSQGFIYDLRGEELESKVYRIFEKKKFDKEFGTETLCGPSEVSGLSGLPQDVRQEMRMNVLRRALKRFGCDFVENAEAVFVDPTQKETVTFYYGTKDLQGRDNEVMVGITFNERYGGSHAFACTRESFNKHLEFAQRAEELDESYKAQLDTMSVKTYIRDKKRLTAHHT